MTGPGLEQEVPGLRPAQPRDYDFLWNLHRLAFRSTVEAIWGWDEAWQAQRFRARFDPARIQIIRWQGQDVGELSVEKHAQSIFLARIAILPAFQNQGIGSAVIRQVQGDAAAAGLPVTLQVLKGNRAKDLYERLGFMVTADDEERHFLSTLEVHE